MKYPQPKENMGATRKINTLNNINCVYGSVKNEGCKAIYIKMGTWLTLHPECYLTEVQTRMNEYKRNLNHFIRAHACKLHPDYLYSLIELSWSDGLRLKSYKSQAFLDLDITILLKEPLVNLKKNLVIAKNMEVLVKEIEGKMTSPDWLTLDKKKTKKIKASPVLSV